MFSRKEECPICHSADNVAVYENDSGYESWSCFTAGCTNKMGDKQTTYHTYDDYLKQFNLTGGNSRKMGGTKLVDSVKAAERYEQATPIKESIRGIKPEVFKHYGYRLSGQDKLVLPVKDIKGAVVGYKWRMVNKTKDGQNFGWVRVAEDTNQLIGMHLAAKDFNLIITEGELDALSAYQMSGGNSYSVVSVPNGASAALKSIDNCIDFISKFKNVIIAMDNDEAGNTAAREILGKYPEFKKLVFPEGSKDCNEWLQSGGKGFADALYQTKQQEPDYIVSSADLRRLAKERLHKKDRLGFNTGIKPLNEMIGGFRRQEVTMLIAAPGRGKSTLCRQITYAQALAGRKVLVVSSEEKSETWVEKISKLHTGDVTDEGIDAVVDLFEDTVTFIDPLKFANSPAGVDELVAAMNRTALAKEVDLVVFDNITHVAKGASSKYYELINKAATELNRLTLKSNCHLIVVGHETKKVGDEPSLADTDGGNGINQFSHNVLSFKREDEVSALYLLKRRESYDGLSNLNERLELTYDPYINGYIEHYYEKTNGNIVDTGLGSDKPDIDTDIFGDSPSALPANAETVPLDTQTNEVENNAEPVLLREPTSNVLGSATDTTPMGGTRVNANVRQSPRANRPPASRKPSPTGAKPKPSLSSNRPTGGQPQPGLPSKDKQRKPVNARMQERWKRDREGRVVGHQMVADITSGKATKPWTSEVIQGAATAIHPSGKTIPIISDWQLDCNRIQDVSVPLA